MNTQLKILITLIAVTFCFALSVGSVSAKDESIDYQIMVQRATQTAIWSMPAVGLVDLKKATIRDLGGTINDVVYLTKPFDSKHGFLTANDVTAYAWGSVSSAKGPVVVEVPPATDKVSYFGTIVNAWQQPIDDVGPEPGADKGKGGKYLLLPPGYKGDVPSSGYLVYQTDTYEYGFAFRPRLYNGATDADAAEYAQRLKVYYLADADNPPATKYLHATAVRYDSLPVYDYTFFQDLNDVVQKNPVRVQDKVMISLLKSVGIEKGKPFAPTDSQKAAMNEGLKIAYDAMQSFFVTPGKGCVPLWKGVSDWQVWNFAPGQPESGFPYESEEAVLVDERAGGSYFWITYLPKYLGGGTFYLTGLRDSDGAALNGTDTYMLNVPAKVPAKDFWSVIVYSMKSKGFVTDAERVGLSSRNLDTLQANKDGSYDIYFAPKAPQGKESNWIPTGENFFLLFRLYGPETKDFYKTWSLGDLVKVK